MVNNEVLAFLAVVEEGSFTAAANKLQTSKARVSQQVTQLELKLSFALLHRTTRKIKLTDAGKIYYAECRRAHNILTSVTEQLNEQQNSLSGHIRINSVGGLFAENLLSKALSQFMAVYPNISIVLDLTSHRVDILDERFDIVIRMGEIGDSSLVARPLMNMSTYIVASPDYIDKPLNHPEQLKEFNCLCGSVTKWKLTHAKTGLEESVAVTGNLSASNGHIVTQMARDGLGIARINALYTEELLRKGELIHVFEDWYTKDQPVSVIYPKARFKSHRIRTLIEYLVDHFAALGKV